MECQRCETTTGFGLLLLRLGIGGFMLTHGWGKLQMLLAGDFDKFADPIGLGNQLSLILVTGAEFGCALLVMLGLATRLAAIPLVFAMGVAAFIAHANDPWTMTEGARLFSTGAAKSWASKEAALLFLFPFLALIFTGPGKFSLDGMIWQSVRGKWAKKPGTPAI